MNDLSVLGIPIAFTILIASMLWIIIGGRGHWLVKMGFVAIGLYFSIALWMSLNTLIGWPTRQQLPEKFQVNWIVIKEAKPNTKEESMVYMWVTELDENNKPKEQEPPSKFLINFTAKKEPWEPRAFYAGYSRELHKQAQQALQMIREGKPVYSTREAIEKALGQGDGQGEGQGEGQGNGQDNGRVGNGQGNGREGNGRPSDGRKGGGMTQNDDQVFHVLPPTILPPKPK